MFKNVEEVLEYTGNQIGIFKSLGEEMTRLKDENIELKNTLKQQEKAIAELTEFITDGRSK